MFGKAQKQSLGDMDVEHDGAAPMDGAPDEHDHDANPRLEAIRELLKFLSNSEAKRAMPEAPKRDEPKSDDALDEEHLTALRHMAR